jgi:UDP-2-acetamido-2,6-beta-L-arabino-hexul-4-ose reductase
MVKRQNDDSGMVEGQMMTHVLVTGARGFVGRNLCAVLRQMERIKLAEFDQILAPQNLEEMLRNAEVIFHLAGVNRPPTEEEFLAGNAGFTEDLCSILERLERAPKIVFASSIQADLDNAYGMSKRYAEDALRRFAEKNGAECVVYRLKNLFGKWCRPNYNSVTATFCHNIAHGLPIKISDPARALELTYIDDVVEAFIAELQHGAPGFSFAQPLPSTRLTLGLLAERIQNFRELRSNLQLPDFSSVFDQALYATYLSYLNGEDFGYSLHEKSDQRGSLAEFLKSSPMGQIFVSRTRPGVTRGNHYHHTKTEKFLVVQGEAVIRFRHIEKDEVIEHRVLGEDYRVLDIPPGYTHSIENVGQQELVTLFWASEIFDPDQPDTYFDPVLKG